VAAWTSNKKNIEININGCCIFLRCFATELQFTFCVPVPVVSKFKRFYLLCNSCLFSTGCIVQQLFELILFITCTQVDEVVKNYLLKYRTAGDINELDFLSGESYLAISSVSPRERFV